MSKFRIHKRNALEARQKEKSDECAKKTHARMGACKYFTRQRDEF